MINTPATSSGLSRAPNITHQFWAVIRNQNRRHRLSRRFLKIITLVVLFFIKKFKEPVSKWNHHGSRKAEK
jgi:hypothetical protein